MREMCFRGKRLDNGEWAEGSLHIEWGETDKDGNRERNYRILGMRGECDYIDPATVGQYTGLTDKNDRKIFEGDIVKTHYANVPKADFVEEVVFHNGKFCALYQKDTAKMWMPLADGVPHHPRDKAAYMEWCEVIGNIHDNPEMLKQEVQ